jgi:hypothetical protein
MLMVAVRASMWLRSWSVMGTLAWASAPAMSSRARPVLAYLHEVVEHS